ncbi:MAG: hypothetical protein DRJ66_05760 [Thermoprotei archaeon]|nr:MAG: hypothetical protein DRJ66_05760 [Thermoprotei archaeon]
MRSYEACLIALTLFAEVLTFASLCAMSLIPVFSAYILKVKTEGGIKLSILKVLMIVSITGITIFSILPAVALAITVALIEIGSLTERINMILSIVLIVTGLLSISGVKVRIQRNMPFQFIDNVISRTNLIAFFYGLAYVIVSISCSLPVLLMLISVTLRTRSVLELLFILLTYSIGIIVPFMAVGVITAIPKEFAVRASRLIALYIDEASSMLLIVAGIYLLLTTLREMLVLRIVDFVMVKFMIMFIQGFSEVTIWT